MAWREDDDDSMIRALAELSERCEELEQRLSEVEAIQEFDNWGGYYGDEDEEEEDDDDDDDDEECYDVKKFVKTGEYCKTDRWSLGEQSKGGDEDERVSAEADYLGDIADDEEEDQKIDDLIVVSRGDVLHSQEDMERELGGAE